MIKFTTFLSIFIFTSAYADVKYTVLSQDHPPYIDFSSPSTSMVHRLLNQVNSKLNDVELLVVETPYKRAILMAQVQGGNFVITTNFNNSFQASDMIKLIDAQLGFYKSKKTHDIRNIGIVRGEQGNLSRTIAKKHPNADIVEIKDYVSLFNMVEMQRIDALYCAELIYHRLIEKGVITPKNIVMKEEFSIPFEIVLATGKENIDQQNLLKIKQTVKLLSKNK